MKGPDHYLCAELRISEAHRASPDYAAFLMAEAQVHATLALAAATLDSGSNNRGSETHPQEWRDATR